MPQTFPVSREEVERRQEIFITEFTNCFAKIEDLPRRSEDIHTKRAIIALTVTGSVIALVGGILAIPSLGSSLIVTIPGVVAAGAAAAALIPQGIAASRKREIKRDAEQVQHEMDENIAKNSTYISFVIRETARQIARIYEYQINQLSPVEEIRKMARHAVARIIYSLHEQGETIQVTDEMTLIAALMQGKSKAEPLATNNGEWNTSDVFTAPGIRTQQLNLKHGNAVTFTIEYFSNEKTNAEKYGYRNSLRTFTLDHDLLQLESDYHIAETVPSDRVKEHYIATYVNVSKEIVKAYASERRIALSEKHYRTRTPKLSPTPGTKSLNEYVSFLCSQDGLKALFIGNFAGAQTDLCYADFTDADFSRSDLSRAKLRHTNFTNTYLVRVNLSETGLHYTIFNYAFLQIAKLCEATLKFTNFAGANLTLATMNDAELLGDIYITGSVLTGLEHQGIDLGKFKAGEQTLRLLRGQEKIEQKLAEQETRILALEKDKKQPRGSYIHIIEPLPFYYNRSLMFSTLEEKIQNNFYTVITGIPGCGKSQLSFAYAKKFSIDHKNGVVCVINADNEEILAREYRELAIALGLNPTEENHDRIKGFIDDALSRTYDGFLLVFDNVGIDTNIRKYLPPPPLKEKGGRILITTLNKHLAKTLGEKDTIPVIEASEGFSLDEVREFLQTVITVDTTNEDIEKLAEKLLYSPFSIAAAKLYCETYSISPQRYLSYLNDPDTSCVLYEAEEEIIIKYYERREQYRSQKTAIKFAIDQLVEKDRELLLKFIFLMPKNISVKIIIKGFNIHEISVNRLLRELENHSLIAVNGKDDQRSISLHFITREIARSLLPEQKQLEIFQSTLRALDKLIARNNLSEIKRTMNEKVVPHVEELFRIAREQNFNIGATSLDNEHITLLCSLRLRQLVYYQFTGQNIKARELLQDLKIQIEKKVGICLNLDEREDIEDFCVRLKQFDPKLPTLYAQILYHLARSYIYIKDIPSTECENYLEQALTIREIIDKNNKDDGGEYDDSYNDLEIRRMDSTVFRTGGKFLFYSLLGEEWLKLPEQERISRLKIAEEGYMSVIKQEEEQPEGKKVPANLKICYGELVNIYRKLTILSNDLQKQEYLNKWFAYACKLLEIKKEEANLQSIKEKLEALQKTGDSRTSKYCNMFAQYFLEINNLEAATTLFTMAKEIELAKGETGKNFPLAEAYYGLAKIYSEYEPKDLNQALANIEKCLDIGRIINDRGIIAKAEHLKSTIQNERTQQPSVALTMASHGVFSSSPDSGCTESPAAAANPQQHQV